jgi:hypothetical protein
MSSQVEAYDGPEPARAEIARRFLAEMAPPEPSPLAELSLPKPEPVLELLDRRPDVVRWAYLTGREQETLRWFARAYEPASPRAKAAGRQRAIDAAIGRVVASTGEKRLLVHALTHTALWALHDAFCDWRDHGPPELVSPGGCPP